jgi:hypothetical protein
MPELRYTATDQLANVIDAIQIGRKTGVLTVTRGEGGHREEGSILFVSGQVVRATIGFLIGADALQNMLGWTTCQFLFQPSPSSDMASPETNTRALIPASPSIIQNSPVVDRMGTGEHSSPLLIIPYRIYNVDIAIAEMAQRGLSRTHRRLFLLLDGQRSIKDLVILMGRSPNEIFQLLDQLEQAGFIRQ